MVDDTVLCPAWLTALIKAGYRPYIATSRKLLSSLNTKPFGVEADIFLMEEPSHAPFLEAYLLSNSLSFSSPNMKMPHWVLIDCALMQTAVVGFTVPVGHVPEELLAYFREDKKIDFAKLDRIPVSGQISATNIDQNSMTGISLFSLGRQLKNAGKLGLYTKTLSLETYRARSFATYYGIAQYNNPSLKVHGRFAPEMEIYQSTVLLHAMREMTFVYKMTLDYNPNTIDQPLPEQEPDFWLNAYDTDKKHEIAARTASGERAIIVPPFSVQRDESVFLPIVMKKN